MNTEVGKCPDTGFYWLVGVIKFFLFEGRYSFVAFNYRYAINIPDNVKSRTPHLQKILTIFNDVQKMNT